MKKYRLTAWILICILTLSGCGMVGDTKSEHEPKIFGATYMTRNNPYFDVLHEAIEEVVEANGDILISRDPSQDQEKQNDQIQEMIDEGIEVKGKKLVLAGAGGAGTAIATQAALDGFYEIAFFNRKNARFENAEKLAEKINQETDCKVTMHDLNDKEDFRKSLETADVYCDATSVGMVPLEEMSLIEDPAWFHEDMAVCDIVYAPRTTKLMKVAKKANVRHVINGLGMVLNQGAAAFELWCNQKMPIEYVKKQVFDEV